MLYQGGMHSPFRERAVVSSTSLTGPLPAQVPVLEVEAAPRGGAASLYVLLPVTDVVTEGHVLLGI